MNENALKDRIHAIAEERGITFNACWSGLLLERFLARLAASEYSDQFIFKGGFLLSYLMQIGRETKDLDFLLTRMKAEKEEVKSAVQEILDTPSVDGFVFSFDSIELLTQPHMEYPGYRVTLKALFVKIRGKIVVDMGIGDFVGPLKREIPLVRYRGKPLFESTISLQVYPIEFIFSEKLETVLSKGENNSRMKDYHDLFLMIRKKGMLDVEKLKEAVAGTFSHRGTTLRLIQFEHISIRALQSLWASHLRGLGDMAEEVDLPEKIEKVIEEINQYITWANFGTAPHPNSQLSTLLN